MMDELKIITRAEYPILYLGQGAEGAIFAPLELIPASTFYIQQHVSTNCLGGGGMHNVYPQRQRKYGYTQMRYNW